MSLVSEYIEKIKSGKINLEVELIDLIKKYNKFRDTYLFIYCAAISKPIPGVALEQQDYYYIYDLLSQINNHKKIDIYIETPGGSGETAEEIVNFLHKKFDEVSFVVSGEAKSAGTIIVLSGNDIFMTETGSLGPIDAQVSIGRSVISAYDYIEWINQKMIEADKAGQLNPLDATIAAQISPGELGNVYHALKFAEDLVKKWLADYKFKYWTITESRQEKVTDAMKKKRSEEIAKEFINHSKWRSHGRSIKIEDLENMKLKINKIDDNPKLADIVYRIQTVCKLIFDFSTTFKILATQDAKMFKQAVPVSTISSPQMPFIPTPSTPSADVSEFEVKCPKCGEAYKIYAKLADNPKIDEDYKKKGFIPFPKDSKIICRNKKCEFEIDLLGFKNLIESKTGKKILF